MIEAQSLEELAEILDAAANRRLYRQIDFFEPYEKQVEFFDRGLTFRERLLMAGNQVGKTYSGAAEMAFHLTGEYPPDWQGFRVSHPVKAWAAGETGTVVRDVQQRLLCGEPGVEEALGTGMIPRDCIHGTTLARGVSNAYDTVLVEHRTDGQVDGVSVLRFKSYEQGSSRFESDTVDVIWLDEEPDEQIYSAALTRITATRGRVYMTFTPLKGMSNVVKRFMNEASPDRTYVNMTIDDAKHIPEEERQKIIDGYPEWQREARARGIPMLGSGAIYQISDAAISEPSIIYTPAQWTKLWSIDFGIDHPFAAVLSLWDRDNDVFHIHHAIRIRGQFPINHAAAMKPIGVMVPVAWPHDGNNREKGSGEQLYKSYKKHGLLMLPEHATFSDGGYSPEAGILEINEAMRAGKFKVAAQLSEWFEEKRLYHRKDGLIVKQDDDLMDATRMGWMMRRFGRAVALGGTVSGRKGPSVAKGIDFDVF